MNNKGFAITTMLYGTFLVFFILMFVMFGIINSFRSNMDKLIEGDKGARKIMEKKCPATSTDTKIKAWCGY